ncbi:hypothetical protein ABZV60_34850, partial [Streptomyces sp. NPDC004787]|uniref:hypothetical protein n=1 Tax=Streptomyces sp. NPDC004787 TaxID=3154291 RepID=UPI0033BE9887
RAQARALPRLHRYRDQPHQLPATHQVKRGLNELVHGRDRFSSDIARAQALAKNMLLGVDSDIEVRGGAWFLGGGWSLGAEDRPANIASNLLGSFVLAYAFELAERAEAEKGI